MILDFCNKSFFFSHRILWFINSIDFQKLEDPLLNIALLVKNIEDQSKNYDSLYLSHSKKIKKCLNSSQENFEDINIETHQFIQDYHQGEVIGHVNPLCIPLRPFGKKNAVDYFYSTINFFDCLRDVSFDISKSFNKIEYLQNELRNINNFLPASVYIPFNSDRNYCVLHIPILEACVFSTKERTPFKISIEVYNPYEELKHARDIGLSLQSNSVGSENSLFLNDLNRSETLKDNFESINSDAFNFVREELHYTSMAHTQEGLGVVYAGDTEENDPTIYQKFEDQETRVRNKSIYGKLKTWKLVNLIVKSGDDLRQEQLAIQLITLFKQIFTQKKIDIWLYPYEIIATHQFCGIIECVPNAISIDGLKKALPFEHQTLYDYFCINMGKEGSRKFKSAQKEFMKSLAGYSLVCYILQIKDRHNGNILIDTLGHIIHIDFGYMLSNSPGRNFNFESAPFKLTEEFERILGGRRSSLFIEFRSLCVQGYIALKEKAEQIILMVEMMRAGSGSTMPCFTLGEQAVTELRERLLPKPKMSKADSKEYINLLIDESLDHWTTKCYDRLQYCCQGIFY
jgi:phosphatidylinositol 4-kinase B